MNESPNTTIEALKIITEFFSQNSITIVLLVLLIICRKAISDFISRLTSFSFKNGKSTIGLEAVAPTESKDLSKEPPSADEKPSSEEPDSQIGEVEKKEGNWLSEVHKAFDEGRFDDAEKTFKNYALDEKDEVKLQENKAFYLYIRFEKAKDNSAIEELEVLARSAKTEDSKIEILMWLSFILSDSMQYGKEINLWQSALAETKSEILKTKIIGNLAHALDKGDKPAEAKSLLIKRLTTTTDDAQKSALYNAISTIETSLGNKILSIYCKDKSLEFDTNNRNELFNSAYAASNEDIDEISLSNYIKLIRIDGDNSTALNNLGVRAQEAGLKIKAIENYKKSTDFDNTLAMANQGYALLQEGFADEAENIANRAIELGNPHKNVYSLISKINENKEEQDKKWVTLQENSLERQKIIREYTEQHYLGSPNSLKGGWLVDSIHPTTILIENEIIKANWVEPERGLSSAEYTAELIGKVSGSTFEGKLTRKRNQGDTNALLGLGGNTEQSCIGYISKIGHEIKLVSSKSKDVFSLCLTKSKQ